MTDTTLNASMDDLQERRTAASSSLPCAKAKPFDKIPGPGKLPLLGNLHQLDLKKLHLIVEDWSDEFGPIYKFYMGTKPVVAIADESVIYAVLRNRPQGYRRWSAIETVFEEMGIQGVFSVEGDDWRRQRRLAMQALNTKHLHSFFPTLLRVTQRLKKRWDNAAANNMTVDAHADLMRYTVDITTALSFGYDMNTLEKDNDLIQAHLEKIVPMVNQRINSPIAYWRYFKLGKDRELDKSLAFVREEITEFIKACRAEMAENPDLRKKPGNFLQGMLATQEQYSNEEIFGNVLTVLLAGEDTTANSIAWLLYFLSDHPTVQKKMQREADKVLGADDIPKNFKDMEKLSYIEAVSHEVLRLKPPAPIVFVETNRQSDLGGYSVPAGTSLMLLTRKVGLKKSNFVNPDAFQPERWLTSRRGTRCSHNANALMPFGAGPRFCPGRNLAMLEIKNVAAMTCRNFSLTRSNPKAPVTEQFAFTMMPTNLMINFSPRNARLG